MLKLGRWVYCKYCYRNVRPGIHPDGSIVVCTECYHGLAPVDEVISAGSYQRWKEELDRKFAERNAQ